MEDSNKDFYNRAFFDHSKDDRIYRKASSETVEDEQMEELVFRMKDKEHDFTIGLTTILQALLIAEQEYCVPELPAEWKDEVIQRHLNGYF